MCALGEEIVSFISLSQSLSMKVAHSTVAHSRLKIESFDFVCESHSILCVYSASASNSIIH